VLTGLGHRPIDRGDHENGPIHLGSTGDHVLDVVTVTGAVHVSIVAGLGLIFNVRNRDRQDLGRIATEHLGISFGDLIVGLELRPSLGRQRARNSCSQRGLAMVDVADRANIHMRLRALELLFSHCLPLLAYS